MAAAPAPGKGIRREEPDPRGTAAPTQPSPSEIDLHPSGPFPSPGPAAPGLRPRGQLGTRGPDGAALRPAPRPPRPADRSPASLGARTARVPSPSARCPRMASGILVPGPGMGTHPLSSESRKS
ncbi:basic proline-rich protein-like [Cervus elaphus]|uniref:basic proline-rich protein-like n=1 Tax=Cervus elaphus TaxID=9860 RepID=UPI001CC29030|nr:basic proline-rich protein-like [Cervus elaphus]